MTFNEFHLDGKYSIDVDKKFTTLYFSIPTTIKKKQYKSTWTNQSAEITATLLSTAHRKNGFFSGNENDQNHCKTVQVCK